MRKLKKTKAFTLIELLVVVAIIGILAAVGVVAYNGYTASAKANSTKTMHSNAVKYISAEIQKCSLGESKFMGTNQDCPATGISIGLDRLLYALSQKDIFNFKQKSPVLICVLDENYNDYYFKILKHSARLICHA